MDRWVEVRREYLNNWTADKPIDWDYVDELVNGAGEVVARYDRFGRLIDQPAPTYSKNDPAVYLLPNGGWTDTIAVMMGSCTCIACTQKTITEGKVMDRDQVAQVAEMIGSSLMPDNSQWINRFTVPSSSSARVYTVAQRRNDGVWGCSCPAWINRRHCKHLVSILKQLAEVQTAAASDPMVLAMLASARTAYLDLDQIPGGSGRFTAKMPTYNRQIDL